MVSVDSNEFPAAGVKTVFIGEPAPEAYNPSSRRRTLNPLGTSVKGSVYKNDTYNNIYTKNMGSHDIINQKQESFRKK